ncbi:hypothetical protein OR221_0844 [Microbacterium laevaniformans OR221]|nr:hypothetical protein OR221_0844 [Microbacterium laevaniformans OR221]
MEPYIEVTVQQGGGGFMRHASRTPVGNATLGHFYGVTACKRRFRPLRHDAPPREFTATEPQPKPTWNGGTMNRYCPECIRIVAHEPAEWESDTRQKNE